MSGIRFEPYRPGDEESIVQLFETCFDGRTIPLEYWRWRFLGNPTGQNAVELAWDEGCLAGHYAVSPAVLMVNGKDCMAGLSATTMIHPAYRGRKLFPELAGRLYTRLAESGFSLVWGFPNSRSHRGFVRDINWDDVAQIPFFALDLSSIERLGEVSTAIVELQQFDPRFDGLWVAARPTNGLVVKRDSKYLNWRFKDNPANKYRILAYVCGSKLLGYAVISVYEETHLQVVDILFQPEVEIGLTLIKAAIDIAVKDQLSIIKMWLPVNLDLHQELERWGFVNTAPVTYFGVCPFAALPGNCDAADVRQWYFTMADSDVF